MIQAEQQSLASTDAILCSENGCIGQTSSENIPPYIPDDWRHWIDLDNDCLNTRAEALIRDSLINVVFRSSNLCMVDEGVWYGPYTGNVFTSARELDTEHIVPMENAHYSGGASWSVEQKQSFANDLDNIVLVDRTENLIKANRGPEKYRPPRLEYHCEYAFRWRDIKRKYNLLIDRAEDLALQEMEATCNIPLNRLRSSATIKYQS